MYFKRVSLLLYFFNTNLFNIYVHLIYNYNIYIIITVKNITIIQLIKIFHKVTYSNVKKIYNMYVIMNIMYIMLDICVIF